ncbi:type III-B CRISPR module-associated Cmr3 family protein [Acrocarpospora sp. B8E8]|uniref:type III-B CRISPR module-associated Cmr3 family protein n=1 Tax=Acrocarpospora sp. B8E8 TaxID=3153572 RepID=UPI00325CD2D8
MTRWVVLEPLDTIVIRDGRAFDAGTNSEARAVLPSPSTIAGAVGAAYGAPPGAGRDPAARGTILPERVQRPFIASRTAAGWETHWPLPGDVIQVGRGLERMRLSSPGPGEVTDLSDQVEMFLSAPQDSEPAEGWWDGDALGAYLCDGRVSGNLSAFCEGEGGRQPWRVERRVGIARENRMAAEGMIYSTEHLRLAEGHGLAARCVGGPMGSLPVRTVDFGGRGRRAQIHQAASVAMPEPVTDFPGGRMLLYLATPAVFPGGDWKPRIAGARLVAAAVGPPQVITTVTASGGRVRGGLLMWAAPAASVYYLCFPDEEAAAQAAGRLQDEPLEQAEDWMRSAGFGFALPGRWSA